MMAKLFGIAQWKRFVGGVLLALFGGGFIVADVVTAYRASQQPHPPMLCFGLLIAWFGGVVIDSKWMLEVTHDLVNTVGPLLKTIMLRGGGGNDAFLDYHAPATRPQMLADPHAAAPPAGPPPPPPPPGT